MHTGAVKPRARTGLAPPPSLQEASPCAPHLDHQAPGTCLCSQGDGGSPDCWPPGSLSISTLPPRSPIIHTTKSSIRFLCFKHSEPVHSPKQIPQEKRLTGFPGQLLSALKTASPQACVYPSPNVPASFLRVPPQDLQRPKAQTWGSSLHQPCTLTGGGTQDPRLPLVRPQAPVSPEERRAQPLLLQR